MRQSHFHAAGLAIFLLLSQRGLVQANPLPVHGKQVVESQDWARSLSLKPLSGQEKSALSGGHKIGTSSLKLQSTGADATSKATWGSELSLGVLSDRMSSSAFQSKANDIPKALQPIQEFTPQAEPRHASTKRKVPTSTSDSETSSSEGSLDMHRFVMGREHIKDISESSERTRQRVKIRAVAANNEEELPAQTSLKKKEAKKDTNFLQAAQTILDELLVGYNSQDDKSMRARNRKAINRRLREYGIFANATGRVWQSMRSEFGRRYPGRQLPNFLESKTQRTARKLQQAALKNSLQGQEQIDYSQDSSASNEGKEAVSAAEGRRRRISSYRKVALQVYADVEPRLNAMSQTEVNEILSKYNYKASTIGFIKQVMTKKWIESNPDKKVPDALIPRSHFREQKRRAKVQFKVTQT